MANAAQGIKKLSLELGGNAPFIDFDDVDLDAAVEGASAARFRAAGQTCGGADRIYAQGGIHDAFAEKLAAREAALKVGDGAEPGVQVAPLISARALEKVEAHLSDAVAGGASVVARGRRVADDTLFFKPTVRTGVTQIRVSRGETFGAPRAGLSLRHRGGDDPLANDTGRRSTGDSSPRQAPFVILRGLDREGCRYGFEEYLEKYAGLSI